MLQKTEDIRHQRFLAVVDSLKLRFPGKVITEKTGYNSGIVSEYLKSKKIVSERFLRKFCEVFQIDYDTTFSESPFEKDDPLNWERAAIKALSWGLANALSEISELKGKRRDPETYLEEIDRSTNMILHDQRRSGK
jgi:transcriptional regulator with XRE-family HTH domain